MSEKTKCNWSSVKDSGIREEFYTGSKRDTRDGKGRYDLLPFYALHRLARVYENGARKYGASNWRKGQPCSRYLDSGIRHLMKAAAGWKDEDHLAQAMWNICGIIETEKMVELGTLPPELNDLKGFTPSWEESAPPLKDNDTFDNTFINTMNQPSLEESAPSLKDESDNPLTLIDAMNLLTYHPDKK